MGLYPQPSAPESLFGGAEGGGGGGAGGCCVHPPMRGGVAGGSSVRLGRKYPVASPGLVGPFEEEPRIRRGGLRDMVWYGMVWYGMVWYGRVWYGMVWYGMVWYGMVWYGMVWYGMVWYGMVWYVVVVVVKAPSTCRREKLPDTLSPGRAQGSSRPASRWPGVCRQRPRGGGGGWFRPLSGGEGGRASLREGLPVCVTHVPSPAAGGGLVHL